MLAAAVRLLETTLIRVGNEEYARQNGSYGLTTLREDHLQVNGSTCRLIFRGKSGKKHAVDLTDHRLARLVQRCQSLPGEDLFQYVNGEGQVHHITSTEVNDYLRDMTGQDFTAKDFRTWAGTVLAACMLEKCGKCATKVEAKRNIVRAIQSVAEQLGNSAAICRKCYIHPSILEAYLNGTLLSALGRPTRRRESDEARVLVFLQRSAKRSAKARRD